MNAKLINGSEVAKNIRAKLKQEISSIEENPGLAVVKIGDDPASEIYVNHKIKACNEVGINSFSYDLPENSSEQEVLDLIKKLNQEKQVNGILVQLPLPKHLNSKIIIDNISPQKDIDGFNLVNVGSLATKNPTLRPCTPKGIITLLKSIPEYDIVGKDAVVVGASNIVGRPMALELLNAGATPTICHSRTQRLEDHIKRADILVVAVGIPAFVPGSWIKPYSVVVDVGINRLDDGTICGDVFFQEAKDVAGYITPVPGGVGPMTIATLLDNTWQAYQNQCLK